LFRIVFLYVVGCAGNRTYQPVDFFAVAFGWYGVKLNQQLIIYNMIQDQLVEYISSQIKLGISRDAIKAALIGAGWKAEDVDETLKKVDGGASAVATQPIVAASQPVQSSTSASKTSSPFTSFSPSDIVGETKNVQPQAKPQIQARPITMNDFVSGPAQDLAKPYLNKKMDTTVSGMTGVTRKSKGDMVAIIIEAVIMIALAGLSGYLYFQNKNLDVKISGLNGQGTDVATQLTNLNGQLQTFSGANASLTAQVASLTAQNVDLQTNLSFFTVSSMIASGSSSTATTTVTVSGTLSGGGKALYAITTSYGTKVLVKNSINATTSAVLAPLVGTTVQVTGDHIPGSPSLTVTMVNGIPAQ